VNTKLVICMSKLTLVLATTGIPASFISGAVTEASSREVRAIASSAGRNARNSPIKSASILMVFVVGATIWVNVLPAIDAVL
jgi:hypothetical protein